MKYLVGDLLRAKQKRTVPTVYQNKHVVVISGPTQTKKQHNNWGPPLFVHFITYTIYIVEDLRYEEVNGSVLNEYFKLDVRMVPKTRQRQQ